MSPGQTFPETPVVLPDPTRPPKPTPGCGVCTSLDQQRAAADHAGDIHHATTLEVDIRNHPKHREEAAR